MRPWTGLKSSADSKVWFNGRTGDAYVAAVNHSADVVAHKGLFGANLDDAGVTADNVYDYDGRALFAAMREGWVRIRIDIRNPDMNSNAEATDLRSLRRGMLWYADNVGTPKRFIVVLRTGAGDKEGQSHQLDTEGFEWLIKKGSFPQRNMESVSEGLRRYLKIIQTTLAG